MKLWRKCFFALVVLNLSFIISHSSFVYADWPMAGANPERTSWVPEEVRGNLNVEWYRPIEPYIPYKIQPVAANGKIYVSSAKGLYAINASSGNVDWVYPTELPLGHSPTVVTINGKSIVYVGGYDHKIHAIDATTGQALSGYTPYEAGAGFETNPLVISNTIYVGNRDGSFYALDAVTGAKKWSFPTGGPILFSAAYKNNVVYFASNDNNAYAVNATNGSQIWKKGGFPGAGFHSYWPVIYAEKQSGKDYVIFGGGENIRGSDSINTTPAIWNNLHQTDQDNLFPCYPSSCDPNPQVIWPLATSSAPNYWGHDVQTIDVSAITSYLENNPQNRTAFILDAATGQEQTFDANGNGIPDYAPFTWSGVTWSGNRYPTVINGIDNVLYNDTIYVQANWIGRGNTVGWKWGDRFASRVHERDVAEAVDEPRAFAGGGKVMYWSLCCDRIAGAFDVTTAYGQPNRDWQYYGYSNFMVKAPDYQPMYNDGTATYTDWNGWQLYSGKNQSRNGVYGKSGTTQSPPIPYSGKVYTLRGNTLLAWTPGTVTATKLPLAPTQSIQSAPTLPTASQLQQKLEAEVQKMIAAGPLRPGYHSAGFLDLYGTGQYADDRGYGEIFDYFQNPADTVYSLLLAYPYLSSSTQTQVRNYLQTNYGPGSKYDFTKIVHIGWGTNATEQATQREQIDTPDQFYKTLKYWDPIANDWVNNYHTYQDPSTEPICGFCGYWRSFPPFSFYAAWKYAQTFGGAKSIFDAMVTVNQTTGVIPAPGASGNKLELPPTDLTYFINKPYFLHLYLAGYKGYMELHKLAGYSDTSPDFVQANQTYTNLLNTRLTTFSKDTTYPGIFGNGGTNYQNAFAVARNFMFLTPEVAADLRPALQSQVQIAIDEYQYVAPYWFTPFDNSYGEGTLHHLYDTPALFQAKAWILKQPYNELVKYLDVPAFERGDLFYIQNLVAALDSTTITPSPYDINKDGKIDILDLARIVNLRTVPSVPATPTTPENLDGDSDVDSADLNLFLQNYTHL